MNKLISLDYKLIAISSLILIVNALTMDSGLGIVLPFIQALIVLGCLFMGKSRTAVLLHFLFMLTCFGVSEDESAVFRTGYFATKLFGPITLSYLVAFVLFFATFRNKKYATKTIVFHKIAKLFVLFLASGSMIGLVGLVLLDYYPEAFIGYFVYITMLIVHAYLLINNASVVFFQKCFNLVISLFIASWISSIFNYFSHITYSYSIFEKTIETTITQFSVMALLALPYIKQKKLVVGLFVGYLFTMLNSGASGKFFMNVSIVLLYFIIRQCILNKQTRIKYILFTVIAGVVVFFGLSLVEEVSMFAYKLDSYISLFNIFSKNIDGIAASPYIRIASMMNIYTENLDNPIYFTIGRGFGGYFRDHLGLFNAVDISIGGFSTAYISAGKFPLAHSTFNLIPLLHGFGGFYLFLRLIWQYAKRGIHGSFLNIVAFPWLLISFYYDIQLAVCGTLLLFAAEYDYRNNKVK